MNSVKILLIGDDPNILRTLRRNLVGRGYEVLLALDDQESFEMAQCNPIDSIILNLDFTTMEIDGLAICAKLREISGCPIIVLSSIGSERTKIEALDLGADDYLVMPFSMGEFLARVRSSLRRWTASKSDALDQDHLILSRDLLIDLDSRQVTVREKPVHLTPKEYEVLLYLARQTGKVVTHRELLRAVWGAEYGEEREYLRVFISQLRRKIEQDPLRPNFILTEPGMGYRFIKE